MGFSGKSFSIKFLTYQSIHKSYKHKYPTVDSCTGDTFITHVTVGILWPLVYITPRGLSCHLVLSTVKQNQRIMFFWLLASNDHTKDTIIGTFHNSMCNYLHFFSPLKYFAYIHLPVTFTAFDSVGLSGKYFSIISLPCQPIHLRYKHNYSCVNSWTRDIFITPVTVSIQLPLVYITQIGLSDYLLLSRKSVYWVFLTTGKQLQC